MNNISGPRIIIHLISREGLAAAERLVDSAADDVIQYRYDAPSQVLTLRLLDPEGKFIQRVANFSTTEFNKRFLAAEFGTIVESGLNVSTDIVYEMIEGEETSGKKRGFITLFKKLEDSSNNHIVEVIIGPKTTEETNIGDSTKSSKLDGQSIVIGKRTFSKPVGTSVYADHGYGTTATYDINYKDLINGVEDLFSYSVSKSFLDVGALVAVDLTFAKKIESHLRASGKDIVLQMKDLFHMAINSTPTNGEEPDFPGQGTAAMYTEEQLSLTFSPDVRDVSVSYVLNDDPNLAGFPIEIQDACRRLNDACSKLGVVADYKPVLYNGISDPRTFGFPGSVKIVYLIAREPVIQQFEQRETLYGESRTMGILRNALAKLAETDALINEIRSDSPLGLINGARCLGLRSGIKDSNVLSIVFSNESGSRDLGILQGTMRLIKRRLNGSLPDYPEGTQVPFEVRSEIRKAEWDAFWQDYYREQITNTESARTLVQGLRDRGHEITTGLEGLLRQDINAAVDKAIQQSPGSERDPIALASYLSFLKEKQRRGGDTVTIRVPYTPAMSNNLKHGVSLAYLQYVAPPTSNKYSIDSDAAFSNIPTLGGIYTIIRHRHIVSTSEAFTEIDMFRNGDIERNTPSTPVRKDPPVSEPDQEEQELLDYEEEVLEQTLVEVGIVEEEEDTVPWYTKIARRLF